MSNPQNLPTPDFFDPGQAGTVWRVPYEVRAKQAADWARQHRLQPAEADPKRIALLLVDVQNTFCIPDFELFVAGRSGTGAVDDNRRLCEFIYRNLGHITRITASMDTHQLMQVFHAIFFIDANGKHPAPYTLIQANELRAGKWTFNRALAARFKITPEYGQELMIYYAEKLEKRGKYALTIWPYHAMLGGVGHSLISAVEEAIFFHSVARLSQPNFEIKGNQPFTEHYSVMGPEVTKGLKGESLGKHNPKYVEELKDLHALIIAGQAKSHCVAWTIRDLLYDIRKTDASLAKKVYLLEDCTSSVVVPGADYTEAADRAFAKFAQAGMHLVKSSDDFIQEI